jgi:hypothetical protein
VQQPSAPTSAPAVALAAVAATPKLAAHSAAPMIVEPDLSLPMVAFRRANDPGDSKDAHDDNARHGFMFPWQTQPLLPPRQDVRHAPSVTRVARGPLRMTLDQFNDAFAPVTRAPVWKKIPSRLNPNAPAFVPKDALA